ncbi:MAG: hypothetical protein K6D55_09110 [Prevotella sp.]|nr:hypothetical protein [Prevotella sp.]
MIEDATYSGTLADPFNAVSALNYGKKLASGESSTDYMYIKGRVVSIKEQFSTQYGNGSFYISSDGTAQDQFYAYCVLYLGNKKFTSNDKPIEVGDEVIVCGVITNYNGTIETALGQGFLYSLNGQTEGGSDTPGGDNTVGKGTLSGNQLTLVTADLGIENGTEPGTITLVDGTTITFDGGGNTNTPKYYNSGTSIRMYPQNTMTIKASGKTIQSIKLSCSTHYGTLCNAGGEVSAVPGSVVINGQDINISAINSSSTTISNNNNRTGVASQLRLTTIIINYKNEQTSSCSLSINSFGNGSAIFNSVSVRNTTRTFSVNKGANAVITLTPDNGYRIKSLKVNSLDRTSSITNNQYTISNISANTTVEVEFEAIPPTLYIIYVKATGNGYVWYNGTSIRNETKVFSVTDGGSANLVLRPDEGYRIKSLKVNGADRTASIVNDQYTISDIHGKINAEVEFEASITAFAVGGVNYSVESTNDRIVKLAKGNYNKVLVVPSTVSYQGSTWKVTGMDADALKDNTGLLAVIWEPDVPFTASLSNPNLLLYVNAQSYAPAGIKNVVVGDTAEEIVLVENAGNNNFYCPRTFTARRISYTHRYSMNTGIGEARGWETIALPFDVQKVTHESKGEIIPFSQWESGYSQKPFWLKTWGDGGWVDASSIKANTPYIISMPNNEAYHDDYRISGVVTFLAENAMVESSSDLHVATHGGKQFVPTFENVGAERGVYSLNVSNDNETDNGGAVEGSRFILNLRKLHPFEAYMTMQTRGNDFFDISDDMGVTTQEEQLTLSVYNLKGQMMKTTEGMTMEEIRKRLPKGIYVVNGKKMMIK